MVWPALALLLSPLLVVAVAMLKTQSQKDLDLQRVTYLITFPTDLSEERVQAWLRSLSGAIRPGPGKLAGTPTIAFETWATSRGIQHRMRVPWQEKDYIAAQLRSLIPGTTVTLDDQRPTLEWDYGVELGESRPTRQLRIASGKDISASILASIQALKSDEIVLYQWVLTPAPPQPLPSKEKNSQSSDFSIRRLLFGGTQADSDEIDDRRKKLEQPNLQAIARIAASASTPTRAEHLVISVERSLAATHSNANRIERLRPVSPQRFRNRVNYSATPIEFPAQVTVSELAALIAWPIGQPFVAGLQQGASRHLFAPDNIASTGRVLGHSNYPGYERPIALDYEHTVQHVFVGGSTGSGKSVLMANSFAQDVAAGYGGIVIDASNSDSGETLFNRALSYIPAERIDDVIIVDVNRNRHRPVGFNALDQGHPRAVVDQLTDLIQYLYKDTSGVWLRQLMFHGLYTLAEQGSYSLLDLPKLINPTEPEEIAWADHITRRVRDPELKYFWERWENTNKTEKARYVEPLLNRWWQLSARPELRYIFGQTSSAFKWSEALEQNKIVLINLAGLPQDTSSLLGTLFVNALWTAAQGQTPPKANFLYLDEFQLMTRLPMGLDDMLRRARKHNLGVVLATQYIDNLPSELTQAITNTARSRIIFQTSAREARTWQNEFGRQYVEDTDFQRLPKYEAIAQLSTSSGISTPVTLKALAPLPTTNVAKRATDLSAKKYGRPIQEVEAEMTKRREAPPKPESKRPKLGFTDWDPDA